MELTYKPAGPADLELLTATRIAVLRAVHHMDESVDLSALEAQNRLYYQNALTRGDHAAWLVLDGEKFVGCGGVSFYQVLPTYHNPTGRCAYLMNIYTHPDYRRRGLGTRMVELLVGEARRRGVTHIGLDATAMGRPLYEKYGFQSMPDEMILPE